MARGLTTPQRTGIRAIADGRPQDVRAQTLRSLIRARLVTQEGDALTVAGCAEHRRIMSSGDGPEDLKARLNVAFGGGSRW
jgi:hypothetical protein